MMSPTLSGNSKCKSSPAKDPLDITGFKHLSPSHHKPSSSLEHANPSSSVSTRKKQVSLPERNHVKGEAPLPSSSDAIPSSPFDVAQPPKRRGRPPKNAGRPSNCNDGTSAVSPLVGETPGKKKVRQLKNGAYSEDAEGEIEAQVASGSTIDIMGEREGTPICVKETLPEKRVRKQSKRFSSHMEEEEPSGRASNTFVTPIAAGKSTIKLIKTSADGPETPSVSTPKSSQKKTRSCRPRSFLEEDLEEIEEVTAVREDLNPTTPGPTKRGRKRRVDTDINAGNLEVPVVATPPSTPSSPLKSVETSTSKQKGRKPKTPSNEAVKDDLVATTPISAKRRKLLTESPTSQVGEQPGATNTIVCGVCHKEVGYSAFTYHRYSVHHGLARPKGQSQEFTEDEKVQELKKTLERIKKLSCLKCPASYSTLLGFQYHRKRCGVDPLELQNMLSECSVCGKKVMALTAHMKTHEPRPEAEERMTPSRKEPSEWESSPGVKSKRAAAHKATSLLREISTDLGEGTSQTPDLSKAVKLFTEPTGNKVTNSIIAVWKREIAKSSKAQCRYPTCPFTSDVIEQLKEHHISCEIGLKTKAFACIKCPFRSTIRTEIIDHVLSSHVTEKDAAFELDASTSSSSSEDLEDESEGVPEVENDVSQLDDDSRKTIPQNSKTIDKAYGLSASILHRFKSHAFSPLVTIWLSQYHKTHFSWTASLYNDWKPTMMEAAHPIDYLPSAEKSIHFSRRRLSPSTLYAETTGVEYRTLAKFEATLQNGVPMFFCGGSIQGAAWCPMPAFNSKMEVADPREQFLAVSVFKEEHRARGASIGPFESKYSIQIWNCGILSNLLPAPVLPELVMCLAHNHGRIWSLSWCPSGCYDNNRLGLLAAACSDGTIRIFSVPQPSLLPHNTKQKVYEVKPCITLVLNLKESSECTCLHWDQTADHRFIVAGFANGIVGLWDLNAKSPILCSGSDRLFPVWSFHAHSTIISAVSLSPHHKGGRFIVTASTDRNVKLWDRLDPTVPVCWSKRSRVTNVHWRRHFPGVLVCIEDVCTLFRTTTMFYDFGYTGNRQPLLPQNSVVWSATENEYLDVIAHCTDAGEVVVYPSHLAVMDCDDKKLRKQRKIMMRTDLVNVDGKGNPLLNRMNKCYLQTSKKAGCVKGIARPVPESYSLIYNDVTTVVRPLGNRAEATKGNPSSDNMDVILPCDEPITSINKISFNPNLESHTWMFACGENGMVHLLRIETPSVKNVKESYINEWMSS